MIKYKSRSTRKTKQYNVMLTLAAIPTSSLYNPDGTHNRAASHRAHFWNGFEHGTKYPHLVPSTHSLAYCVWRAGVDFKSEITQ